MYLIKPLVKEKEGIQRAKEGLRPLEGIWVALGLIVYLNIKKRQKMKKDLGEVGLVWGGGGGCNFTTFRCFL